jgi:pimeloyl-ACP methyl ester carboxylesterase
METKKIKTSTGEIAVAIKAVEKTIPVIFLHGVYYNRELWKYQTDRITNRTIITVDMPFHGKSKNITNKNWTIEDCANMLIEILDSLKIEKVIAIGHSWGSMTILRAAAITPERFQSIGLCNMPYQASTAKIRWSIRLQHLMLGFRTFYTKQVAKALYGKNTYKKNPALLKHLESSMNLLTKNEIIQTDKAVRSNAENLEPLIQSLKMPVLALRGEDDYVPESGYLKSKTVEGGHVSPIEAPEEVLIFIQNVIENK